MTPSLRELGWPSVDEMITERTSLLCAISPPLPTHPSSFAIDWRCVPTCPLAAHALAKEDSSNCPVCGQNLRSAASCTAQLRRGTAPRPSRSNACSIGRLHQLYNCQVRQIVKDSCFHIHYRCVLSYFILFYRLLSPFTLLNLCYVMTWTPYNPCNGGSKYTICICICICMTLLRCLTKWKHHGNFSALLHTSNRHKTVTGCHTATMLGFIFSFNSTTLLSRHQVSPPLTP